MEVGNFMVDMVRWIAGGAFVLVGGVVAYIVYLNRSQMRGM